MTGSRPASGKTRGRWRGHTSKSIRADIHRLRSAETRTSSSRQPQETGADEDDEDGEEADDDEYDVDE